LDIQARRGFVGDGKGPGALAFLESAPRQQAKVEAVAMDMSPALPHGGLDPSAEAKIVFDR